MKNLKRARSFEALHERLIDNPVTAILGPRQCGKTTLAHQFGADHHFDLENPSVLAALKEPKLLLEPLKGLIVIDEIQRKPELFPLLRYLVDYHPEQHYLILGSASRELIKQSSETLAGRISYYTLGGFAIEDIYNNEWNYLWLRGGFPRSFLSRSDKSSLQWRNDYIQTFLERDIPELGIRIPSQTLRRFWTMLSHYHGQTLNISELARSFGISENTARNYLEILEGTFMIRLLKPWFNNTGKRLIKSPKLYIRDSGIFHALQEIHTWSKLHSHPKVGASWESFALEQVALVLPSHTELYFWSTHNGAEIDLVWSHLGDFYGVEFKLTDTPKITKSMLIALDELKLKHIWVLYPGELRFALSPQITALPIQNIHEIDTAMF